MPARTGEQYLAGLRSQTPEIYLHGQRVEDVTTCPGLANGARSVASLYDMQHDPKLHSEMTYKSPSSGEPVGLSFIAPRTREDLRKRRVMMSHWARTSYGMMGRTPDFLNTSMMAMAEAGDYFGGNRPEFKRNIVNYYEHVRENDLTLTHTLVNLQRNRRQLAYSRNYNTDVAMQIVKETDAGIVVRGPRVLATLGPLSDEIAVYPVRNSQLEGTEDAWRYAFAFCIPCDTPGLRFLCRESFDLGRSTFDHPLGSRFEEMDAIVFMDDVLIPWERVFLFGDVGLANGLSANTHQYNHSGHQVVAKNVAKCEFVLGIASMMVKTLGSESIAQVQALLAEVIENLEIMKALLLGRRGDGRGGRVGCYVPRADTHNRGPEHHDPDVPEDGGDNPVIGVQQLDGPAHRGGLRRATGGGYSQVSGHRDGHFPGTGPAIPLGLGPVRQRLRIASGPLRTLLPG